MGSIVAQLETLLLTSAYTLQVGHLSIVWVLALECVLKARVDPALSPVLSLQIKTVGVTISTT